MNANKFEDANRYLVDVHGSKVPTIEYILEQSQAQQCRLERVRLAMWACLTGTVIALIIAVIAIA